MKARPIIVGVNGSRESVRAAIAGVAIAKRTDVECVLVWAGPIYQQVLVTGDGLAFDTAEVAAAAEAHDREAVRQSLRGRIPDDLIDSIETQPGNAAAVLLGAAERHHAGLIVVGSRWQQGIHRTYGRLTRQLMSTGTCPVLVTDGHDANIERVLVAIDLSWASAPAYREALRWAEGFGARLRALHVVEPVAAHPFASLAARAAVAQDALLADRALRDSGIWCEIDDHTTEKVVRCGKATATIVNEVHSWRADLLVVAAHGKGWVDRILVGSTTDQLMQQPPTMTLVVPATRAPMLSAADVDAQCWKAESEAAATV